MYAEDGHRPALVLTVDITFLYLILMFSCSFLFCAICLNITDRKNAREAEREKRERGVSSHRAQGLPFRT